MISREEKNKKYVDEIKREKTIKISKTIFKILAIIILISTCFSLYVYFIGPKGLKTKEYVIKDSSIPNTFNGIKILHFSDLLYGSTINKNNLDKITKEIKLINPDIVFFTGNIISGNYSVKENEIKELSNFFKNIPYNIGKYAIMGDVDNTNFNLIMENTNFVVIDNDTLEVYNDKDKIHVIGINIKDKKDIKNIDGYNITLINNYDKYQDYNISSNIVLAGHNLGGEIRLFNLPILGNDKYLNTYYEEKDTNIYISSGLGTKNHVRFMNKPSLNVYRLYNN